MTELEPFLSKYKLVVFRESSRNYPQDPIVDVENLSYRILDLEPRLGREPRPKSRGGRSNL